jgi:hypothetical protein
MDSSEIPKRILNLATKAGFATRFHRVVGRASIADLFKQGRRCGVYLLYFRNGEMYVGQAKDVTKRYAQHRKTWRDIVMLSFQVVSPTKLDEVEQTAIKTLDRTKLLRNILHASAPVIPEGDCDLDNVLNPAEQDRWLVNSNYKGGNLCERIVDEELRKKYHARYKKFAKDREFEVIVGFLRHYVLNCLPAPAQTEVVFWSLSCAPSTAVRARVNLNMQDVLTVYQEDDRIWASFHLAKSPLPKEIRDELVQRVISIHLSGHKYKPGGPDQMRIIVDLYDAQDLVENHSVLSAVRLFNLRLMRKGVCMWGKNHCLDLADTIFQGVPDLAPTEQGSGDPRLNCVNDVLAILTGFVAELLQLRTESLSPDMEPEFVEASGEQAIQRHIQIFLGEVPGYQRDKDFHVVGGIDRALRRTLKLKHRDPERILRAALLKVYNAVITMDDQFTTADWQGTTEICLWFYAKLFAGDTDDSSNVSPVSGIK